MVGGAAAFRAPLDTRLRGYDVSVGGNDGAVAVWGGHPLRSLRLLASPCALRRGGMSLGLFEEDGGFVEEGWEVGLDDIPDCLVGYVVVFVDYSVS